MEMEAWGAAELRRIPCGAALRVNKKSLTILQNKCVQLVRELDRKEETLRQLSDAVGCMASAKDMVALQLAHKCDELELELAPLKMPSQEAAPALSLGLPAPANPPLTESATCLWSNQQTRELQEERAKSAALQEQLRQAQANLKMKDEELVSVHALVDNLQVRLKVAVDFHEADARHLHKQIEALSHPNTPWEDLSETSSVTSSMSCPARDREIHLDLEDEGILLPLRESIRASAAAGGIKSGGVRGLSAHSSSNFNKKMGARESVDGLPHQAHKASVSQRRSSLPTTCNPSDASQPGEDSLASKIEKIRMSMDHMLRVSLSPPTVNAQSKMHLGTNTITPTAMPES